MADQFDEIEFSDTGLDDLPQSTLQELEYRAVSSTQQQVAALRAKQYSEATRAYKLTTSNATWQNTVPARPTAPLAPHDPSPPSSDYGLDDEDVIDLDEPSLVIQPAEAPLQHATTHEHNAPPPIIGHDATYPDYAVNQSHTTYQHAHRNAVNLAEPREDLAAMEAHIRHLEQEKAALQQSVQKAEEIALKKAGEIAIIRAKHEKDAKDYERKIAVIQKLHADESAKHRSEAQAALKDRDTIETNNRFLEHDLAQEVERRKRLKPARDPATQSNGAVSSPGTAIALPYRDGFDDHEIVRVSPSKPKDKPKPETPKAGEKRKRSVNPSPVRPLVLATSSPRKPSALTPVEERDQRDEFVTGQKRVDDIHFRTTQRIINHRAPGVQERTLEILTKHTFPSLAGVSVAGLVVNNITHYVPAPGSPEFSLHVCNHLLDLWSRCLDDHYYLPLSALADLLEFVLALGPRSTANLLIERFVPLATKSIDLIAVPLARAPEDISSMHPPKSRLETGPTLSEQINVDHILSIMHDIAMTASFSPDTVRLFWQKMEFDFTLMMLNIPQQLPHMQLVLQMVGASVVPESFGPIAQLPEKQISLEAHTIDRLTNLLFEQPRAPSDEPPYEDTELATLRIEAIRTLSAIAVTTRGSIALAQHRTAVGRLFRFLNDQITSLYDLPLSSLDDIDDVAGPARSTIHKLTTSLINLTIRLAYHLLHHHADLITLREKLEVIPGGHHKFLVSLTRLAFSEQLVYETGIDEEAVDAAHEILDHILTPEEGDAVVEAIETPRGSNVTRASAPG